jgi:predicted alpha/beta superfamily hydrolase
VISGQLRKHEGFRSRALRNQRDLIVYVPPDYDNQPFTRFPVFYMQDGQNLFDRATAFGGVDWNVQGAADLLIAEGSVAPLIIVGVYHAGKARINEYTPSKSPKLGGGRADRYAKFLIQEVMPFIAGEYRILTGPSVTGVGGSSLGGLVSLYLGLKFPQSFGKIAALSPSVWWNQRSLQRFAASATVKSRPSVWLDIGTKEGTRIVPEVEQFRDALVKKGWRLGEDLHFERVEGGEHNEAAWAQRIGRVLEFLYPAPISSPLTEP